MPNDFSAIIPTILAQFAQVLRQATVMPLLVRRDFQDQVAEKGDTITIPIGDDPTIKDVTPSNQSPDAPDSTTDKATIQLDKWKAAEFDMTDKEIAESMDGNIPDKLRRGAVGLAEQMNSDILANYYKLYTSTGAAGTTPFGSDYSEATATRKALNNAKVPTGMRRLVIDPDAEENAINLSSFADASFSGEEAVLREGQIGRKLGFDWLMDQQVPTHTAGSLTGDPTVSGSHSTGVTTVTVATDADDAVALNQGDLINFAGDSQDYSVQADADAGSDTTVDVTIEPELQVALSGGEAVSLAVSSDAVQNIGFHRDAFGLAIRTLEDTVPPGTVLERTTDPVTGIPLRVEVTRQYKQTLWSVDVLYGTDVIRPEMGVRLLG